MIWTSVPPDVRCLPIEESDYNFSLIELSRILFAQHPCPVVVLPREIRKKIIQHLSSETNELGGLLIGYVFTASSNSIQAPILIQITNFIESRTYQSTGVSLTMDTEIWNRVKPFVENKKLVIGWYHSHPNLGAFFSATDRQNQLASFHHPYSLGLVIDPIRDEEKWYVGKESIELPSELVREGL